MDSSDWKFARGLVLRGEPRDALGWLASRSNPDYLLAKPSPWITFPAVRWLRRCLAKGDGHRVFEYGSGGSTLFWLRHGCECVSVEHDEAWAARVASRVPPGAPLDLRRVAPEPTLIAAADFDPGDPLRYQSASPEFRHHCFHTYARQIDGFPDGHFDLVLVDGRSRPACVRHARDKVRPGGALVLDNVERAYYLRDTLPHLGGFERLQFPGAPPCLQQITQTDVFVRKQ